MTIRNGTELRSEWGFTMASPQPDKYTKLSNELLEAFCRLDASGSAWRIFMVVIRKTYGFHKKSDPISLSQYEEMSGLARKSVCRGLKELVELQVVRVEKDGYINKYQVQKDYELWGSVKPVTSDKNDTSVKPVTRSSVKPVTKSSDQYDTYKRKKDIKILANEVRRPLKVKKKDIMGWKSHNENDHTDDVPSIDLDSREEVKKETKVKREYKQVYEMFNKLLGKEIPPNWMLNRTQMQAADNLWKTKGKEKIQVALLFYSENKDHEYCPRILSPYDLDSKWEELKEFKKRNNL